MKRKCNESPTADWQDSRSYQALLCLDRADWAWEFLRRNFADVAFAERRTSRQILRVAPPLNLVTLEEDTKVPSTWGLRFRGQAILASLRRLRFWHAACHPMVLPVEAHPAAAIDDDDAFNPLSVPHAATVLRSIDGEHVLITDGPRSIRLDVVAGSMLCGPVRLGYRLSGFDRVEAKVMTQRRLLALWRLGLLPLSLFPPERKARRWANDGGRSGLGVHCKGKSQAGTVTGLEAEREALGRPVGETRHGRDPSRYLYAHHQRDRRCRRGRYS